MAALTPTLVKTVSSPGGETLYRRFTVTPQADGDTVDLSSYFSNIDRVKADITAGRDAALTFVTPTFSGKTVTLAEKEQDYTAATDWTGAEITIEVEGQADGSAS